MVPVRGVVAVAHPALRLGVGVGDEDVAHDAPVVAVGARARRGCTILVDRPVVLQVLRVEGEAERYVTVLARETDRVTSGREAGHRDRRMRELERLQVRAVRDERRRVVDGPVLALVAPLVPDVLRPDLQHDVERLAHHVAVRGGREVEPEQLDVGRREARGNTADEPALRHVVELDDAQRELGRMVEGQEVRARAELDPLRARDGLRHDQVACRGGLPRHGEVLADPHLRVAELVEPLDDPEILLDPVVDRHLRRVRRLHEHPVFHGVSFVQVATP